MDNENDDEGMVPMHELELGTFWSAICKPGKTTPFVPPPIDANLHVSQARWLSIPDTNGPLLWLG